MISLAAEFPNDNPCLHRGTSWVCTSTTGPATAVRPTAVEAVRLPPASSHYATVADAAYAAPVDEVAPDAHDVVAEAPEAVAVPTPRESGVVRLDGNDVRDDSAPLGLAALAAALDAETDDLEGDLVVEELEPVAEMVVEGIAVVATTVTAEAPEASAPAASLPPPPADPFRVLVSTLVDAALAEGAPAAAAWIVPLLDGAVPEGLSPEAHALLVEGRVLDGGALTPTFDATRAAWRDILRGTSDDFGACASMLDEWAADVLARLMGSLSFVAPLRRDLRARGVAAFGLAFAA